MGSRLPPLIPEFQIQFDAFPAHLRHPNPNMEFFKHHQTQSFNYLFSGSTRINKQICAKVTGHVSSVRCVCSRGSACSSCELAAAARFSIVEPTHPWKKWAAVPLPVVLMPCLCT